MCQSGDLIPAFAHLRTSWSGGEQALVLSDLATLRGRANSDPKLHSHDYAKAKNKGDFNAAARRVKVCCEAGDVCLDSLVDVLMPHLEAGRKIFIAVPHPPFDDKSADGYGLVSRAAVKNALPLAYATYLEALLSATFETEIVQKSRVGRTKLRDFPRFLCQPAFDGQVRTDGVYVLADDVCTIGGTLAALRHHIIAHGGAVAAITALATRDGCNVKLALSTETWDELQELFGDGFDDFWKRSIGHAGRCLTEVEARRLCTWCRKADFRRTGESPLQQLRNRLSKAAAKGE